MIKDLSKTATGCFNKIEIKNPDLPVNQDDHYLGSRLMFETLIDNSINITSPKYIFWMEPDVIPIRKNWIEALQRETLGDSFWIKGSAVRGPVTKGSLKFASGNYYGRHINGCAIYNMQSNEYPQFYKTYVPKYLKGERVETNSFDVLPYLIFNDPQLGPPIWEANAHRFVYTEIIQNLWSAISSMKNITEDFPDTYFIHFGSKGGLTD